MSTDQHGELRRLAITLARAAGAADPELVADQAMERLYLVPQWPEETKACLRTVIPRLVIDAHRRAQARVPVQLVDFLAEVEPLRRLDHPPTLTLECRQKLSVETVLAVLSDADRALLLDWCDGWSWPELSERYGATVPVLQVRLSRIKGKIRAAFPDLEQFELG